MLVITVLAAMLGAVPWTVSASAEPAAAVVEPPAGQGRRQGSSRRISLDEAATMVRERFGGRVIRAETLRTDERLVHRIRILQDSGRVRTVDVDAETGRVID